MSAIAILRFKSVRYLEVFLWEFDRDSAPIPEKSARYYKVSAL